MKDMVWHSDSFLGVSIRKLGESVTKYVQADSLNYGKPYQTSANACGYMDLVYCIILPELHLCHDPRWALDVLPTGSSVEASSNQEVDFMLLPQGLHLDSNHLNNTITEDFTSPAFVYVCLDEEQDKHILEIWKDCCIEENGKLYLSSDSILQKFDELIKQVCLNTLCKVLHKVCIIRQGPSVKLSIKNFSDAPVKFNENPNEHLVENLDTPDVCGDYDFEFDLVFAIPCRSWPVKYISVLDRIFHSQKNIIKSEIINFFEVGNPETAYFHIIPKSSDNAGRYERLEWRLSFSLLERHLFQGFNFTDKFIPSARFAYQALKEWKVLISPKCKNVISIYHVKTAYFWMLEGINDQVYSHLCKGLPQSLRSHTLEESYLSTGNLFLWMVEILVDFIIQKNMPHYFCHNFNLFENKNIMDFNILCEEAEKLKVYLFSEKLMLNDLVAPLLVNWKAKPKNEVDFSYGRDTLELLGMYHQCRFRWVDARTWVAVSEDEHDEKKNFINLLC